MKTPRRSSSSLIPEPGSIVGERYRIRRKLGEGGMGAVYEAEDLQTHRRVAIKWLHPRMVLVEEADKRLLYEARAMALVRHQNVVDIYDVVTEHSSVFLVMELLLGEQLSAHLARETLTAAQLISLLLPAMRGVAAAHAAGVVHRDIKPDNIFIVRDADQQLVPKVIDFGISRLHDAAPRLTRSGMTMGTPRYVSYEQLRGMRDVDHRTDIYAFGVILYECLVGHPPYQASSFGEQAISFVTTEPPRPIKVRPELPHALDGLVYSAIAKHRDDRPPSMDALIAGLLPFADEAAYSNPLQILRPVEPDAQTADLHGSETSPGSIAGHAAFGEAAPSQRVGGRLTARPNWPLFGAGALSVALVFGLVLVWPKAEPSRRAPQVSTAAASIQTTVITQPAATAAVSAAPDAALQQAAEPETLDGKTTRTPDSPTPPPSRRTRVRMVSRSESPVTSTVDTSANSQAGIATNGADSASGNTSRMTQLEPEQF